MQINVTSYLDITAKKYPDKTAIQDSKGEYTFHELRMLALKIANKINVGNRHDSPICVYLHKSKEAIACFAGINYSTNFYVPLDVKSPLSRIENIVNTLHPSLIITDKQHLEIVDTLNNEIETICIENIVGSSSIEHEAKSIHDSCNSQIDTDPVYSIFTSGSTGAPKGVVISHRGVIDYIDWAVETFHIDSSTVIGNQAPFYFDNSTLDIYLMFATGATLNLIPEENFMFPSKLVDYMNENKISFIFWVPFALINVANFKIFEFKTPLYLRDVFFAGEVMPNKHLNYWRKYLPDCRYANLYGPTEITVDCTYYIVDRKFDDNEPLPIGSACKNSDVLILKEDGTKAKTNEYGELCVRGTSLALGYYNDWEKTNKAFIQNPLNNHYPERIYCTGDIVYTNDGGEIIYVGRKDSQIKHNGYRIELGEIETAVLGSKMVDNCCVVYDFTNKRIILFYQNNSELNMAYFRASVLKHIPKYMMPTVCKRVNEMMMNANGKIDRLYYNRMANEKS